MRSEALEQRAALADFVVRLSAIHRAWVATAVTLMDDGRKLVGGREGACSAAAFRFGSVRSGARSRRRGTAMQQGLRSIRTSFGPSAARARRIPVRRRDESARAGGRSAPSARRAALRPWRRSPATARACRRTPSARRSRFASRAPCVPIAPTGCGRFVLTVHWSGMVRMSRRPALIIGSIGEDHARLAVRCPVPGRP